ncbi:hypothetical protein JJB07_19095 [Tumebacillus sp. ITR2]|uniref:Copper amine oxidase-like N-terminal domain-containing protein n=1 Tax=Tumebacillus amylolyticus TaxID=2801339 RepID=A0ABS1JEK1_9BACL|nr:stalk domain-containing protein [Tumebacillus amylolyticus]MBL0388718.1 hypothetical protein [Tumebacillus amylolyticus]
MKKRTTILLSGALLCVLATTAFASTPLKLMLNGHTVDQPLQMVDGVTYGPVRAIAESLGAEVKWNGDQQQVELTAPDLKMQKMQIDLLEQALAPTSPQEAAESWAKAVKERNGAAQYAVSSSELRQKNGPIFGPGGNWVTGVSSPWVEKYEVIDEKQTDDNSYAYKVVFSYATSTGPAGQGITQLIVHRYGDKWFVANSGPDESTQSPELPIVELTMPTGAKISAPSEEQLSDKVRVRLDNLNVVKSEGLSNPLSIIGNHASIKSQTSVELPAGKATLFEVERDLPVASNDTSLLHEYWLVILGSDVGDDMQLAYTLSTVYANNDADPATVKKQLLETAKSWVLPKMTK